MLEIIQTEYWSKSKAFILPLTGVPRTKTFAIDSYLFWDDYSIEDYILTVRMEYGHRYEDFLAFLTLHFFQTGRKGHITQSFDFEGFSILIFDISEYAFDIEQFLKGKYSKFSKEAKDVIRTYHRKGKEGLPANIYACLYPFIEADEFEKMTPIAYVAKYYGFPEKDLKELGELCSIFDSEKETLHVDINICEGNWNSTRKNKI